MKITGFALDDPATWTDPYPTEKYGFKLRLLKGDVMYPDWACGWTMRAGREGDERNWFSAIPKGVVRETVWYRPFISLGLWRWGMYLGWKVFGVDSPAYLDYENITLADVYTGSRAMVPTMRLTTRRQYA